MTDQPRKAYRFFTPTEEPEEVPDASWTRARSAIEKLKRAYVTDWAPASLNELERALKIAGSSPDLAAEHLDAAHRLAHDMKGQGATFGFALVSDIGAALSALTYERVEATPAEIQAMLAHVDAARAVIAAELEDPESPDALKVMGDLQAAVRANLH